MSLRYLECEAAAHFGLGLDDWMRKEPVWRAEMMAYLVMKGQRDMYVSHLYEKDRAKKEPAGGGGGGGGFNPIERQKREWRL